MPEDIVGDWRDWIAPVGVVAGFFELPRHDSWGVEKPPGDPDLAADGRPGLEFFRLLMAARDEPEAARRREIRNRMKALCASLFEEYRESFGAT